jgi:splicing factor 3A subunit 3
MDIVVAPHSEKVRQLLEERDLAILAAIADHSKLVKIKSNKERLKLEHFIRNALEHVLSLDSTIKSYQTEHAQELKDELKRFHAPADLSVFYGMVKQLKEYHRRFANEPADMSSVQERIDQLRVSDDQLERMFSGSESLGKFLDFTEVFSDFYVNKLHGDLDYLHFINQFHDFSRFSMQTKLSGHYEQYLEHLLSYLESFKRRAMPLVFSEDKDGAKEKATSDDVGLREELEKIGKTAFDPSLFCLACDKLFTNPNSHDSHLNGKVHQKNIQRMNNNGENGFKSQEYIKELFEKTLMERRERVTRISNLQAQIKEIAEHLQPQIQATALNIERKQAMTAEELAEEERREAERAKLNEKLNSAAEDDRSFLEKDMDGGVYNPLKLPLDWDGKPIPLWLWKLHGLGTKYPCEVCGNYVYLGRKAFDQHFMEWRHAHGMRCLGVPNTRHFYQITKIDEVLALWAEMKKTAPVGGSGASGSGAGGGGVEEVEDRYGNVYSKRVYEDMRRQGLI